MDLAIQAIVGVDNFYESMQFKLLRPSSTQHTACKVLQHLSLLNLALALPQNLHPKLQILQATLSCEYRNPSLGTPRVDDATKCHQRENMPDLKGLSSLQGIRLQGLDKIWYMAKGHIPKYGGLLSNSQRWQSHDPILIFND